MKALLKILKESCYGNDKVSSKRLIMYTFTFVAINMIFIEAIFTCLLIWKWYRSGAEMCEFDMVFDAVIYGYVFGLIGAIAGINGFSGQKEKAPVTEGVDELD